MTTIAAVQNGGIWGPATPIPAGALEVVASPSGYTVVTEDDLYSAAPPVTPLGAVANVFAGSLTPASTFFGCAYNDWPAVNSSQLVQHGTTRTHDYLAGSPSWRARWNKTEIAPGVFDWAPLDAFVDFHVAAGRQIVHTLFATPAFYSARPTEPSAYNLGCAAEPSDLTKWDAYCTAVATRYLGKIKYYEVWNEPNLSGFYSGTQTILAQMTRRANQAIKAIDPTAKILSAPVTGLQSGTGLAYFTSMMSASDGAAAAMKNWVDIVSVHLYPDNIGGQRYVSKMIDDIRAAMTALGMAGKPLWSTEQNILSPALPTLTQAQRTAAIQRLMTVAAAHNAGGCDVSIWYGADNGTLKFSGDDAREWDAHRQRLLSGGITVVNQLRDGRTAAVIGGQRFLWDTDTV